MKKVFLAIRIPESTEIESYLANYRHAFSFVNMRWNESKYLHLTLKYFGPTSEKRIKKIQNVLEVILRKEQVFEFNIVKLGIFGSKYAPKVMWWGIGEEELLKEFYGKIENELGKIGIYADRQNFVPHITLGRIEKIVSKPFFQRLMQKHKKVEEINVKVDSIVLLESKRVGDGVEYIELVKFEIE